MMPLAVSEGLAGRVVLVVIVLVYGTLLIFILPAIRTFTLPPSAWAGRLKRWALAHRVATAWRVALFVGLLPAAIEALLPEGNPARGGILFALLFVTVFLLLAVRPTIAEPET